MTGGKLATAVLPATTFDPYKIGLGAEIEVPQFFFGESPFGWICRARRVNGEIFAVYTTEHTTADYLDEMWEEMPHGGLNFYTLVRCRKVPPMFGRKTKSCHIHYYATHARELLIGINKAQFLTAQRIQRLF